MSLDLTDPIATALLAADALESAGIAAALYGGLALAAYGAPRETRDADFAVVGATPEALLAALERAGAKGEVAFRDLVLGGARVSRVTVFGTGETRGLNTIDLVEPRSARFAGVVQARALRGALRGHPIAIVSPEDFLLLKALASRDRDVEDGASVLRALGDRLDWERLASEVDLLDGEVRDHDTRARWTRMRVLAAAPP